MTDTERGLPAAIVTALAKVGIRAMRLNAGTAQRGGRHIKLAPPNTPDVLVVSPYLWIECKRRDGRGQLSPGQRSFRDWCRRRGVPWTEATSVEQAVHAALERQRGE